MSALHRISASEALASLDRFDAIIDARSESEFALDHLPGAVNWPTLHDAERVRVGTLYTQVHPFDASKVGAVLAARNIAAHIERELANTPKHWQPLVYCWRGGKRSGSLALVLSQIGFRVQVLEGGYKAFRSAIVEQLPVRVRDLQFRVICGPTGSGKTRLLHALHAAGAQVLDLEQLASHRASVLGMIPNHPQPNQKHFETLLWERLRRFDPSRVVFVESESRKVGNLAVPGALIEAMRSSPCTELQLAMEHRVQLLLEDYPFFVHDPQAFAERLESLTELRGRATVQSWQVGIRAGAFASVVRALLDEHYDPGYAASMQRNYRLLQQADVLGAVDGHVSTFAALALELRSAWDPASEPG